MLKQLLKIYLSFLVIWYEHYGSDVKRTMMNRLVSSVCWSSIEYFLGPHSVELFRLQKLTYNFNAPFKFSGLWENV